MNDERAQRLLTQIEAFDAKVRVSHNSFSGQKLKEFLPQLKHKTDVKHIDSIETLRKLVKKKSDALDKDTGSSNYNDNKTVVYFKWFLDFHTYLRSLKESFDGRVHKHLLQYFYDSPYGTPSPTKSQHSSAESKGHSSTSSLERQISLISLTSSSPGPLENIHPALRDTYQEYKELSDAANEEEINKIAEKLFVTGRQLQRLLREDVPIKQLILSSYKTTHNDDTDDGNDLVLLFDKIFKVFKDSAKQAKQWVQLDATRTIKLHLARQRFKDMHKTVSSRIQELDTIVERTQEEIETESEGLHRLLKREERASDLNSQLFEIEDNIAQKEDELNKAEMEVKSIKEKLNRLSGTDMQQSRNLKKKLQENSRRVEKIKGDIDSKIYCKRILQGDLDIEMHVKPSIIRFTNNVQEKCEKLENDLSTQRIERAALQDFIEKLREIRQRVESEILRQVMLISSLDNDIANHRPSIIPPLTPSSLSSDKPQNGSRYVNLSSAGSAQ